MKKKILIWTMVLFPILVILYGMRPIINPRLHSCEVVEGVVSRLHEGGELDLVIRLKEQPGDFFYINRGLENTFDLNDPKDWTNRKAKIWYVERWTLKVLGNSSWHIARLDISGQTVYDETTK